VNPPPAPADPGSALPVAPAVAARRFVPTLTEVMVPGGATAPTPAVPQPTVPAPPVAAPPPLAATEPLDIDALLRRLGPELDREISEAIARVLHEQLLGLNTRVRQAVAEVVRDAVARALRERA